MKALITLIIVGASTSFANTQFLPNSFSVELDQVYVKLISGKEKRIPSLLEYSYPGKVKFLNKEKKTLFVSNSEQSWYYKPPFIKSKKGIVHLNDNNSFKFVKIFDSLKAGFKSNEAYTVKKISNNQYELNFSKKSQEDFNVLKATLTVLDSNRRSGSDMLKKNIGVRKDSEFTLKDVDKILVQYKDKKEMTLDFKIFDDGVNFKPGYFTFSIPENTSIAK